MKRRSVRQLALDETRKVVYHSHHARVFNSGRANHAKRSGNIVVHLIRSGDYGATFHRRRDVFPAYDHLDFARTIIAGHAFIQDRHQSRLFFEGPKELAHCFSAGKLWLSENVGGSINIDLTGGRLFADQAAFAKQHRVAQQAIIKRLLLAHQRDYFGANRQQTLATKLSVQIPSRLIQFVLAKILIDTDTSTTRMRLSGNRKNLMCWRRFSASGGHTTIPTFSESAESTCEALSIKRSGRARAASTWPMLSIALRSPRERRASPRMLST